MGAVHFLLDRVNWFTSDGQVWHMQEHRVSIGFKYYLSMFLSIPGLDLKGCPTVQDR